MLLCGQQQRCLPAHQEWHFLACFKFFVTCYRQPCKVRWHHCSTCCISVLASHLKAFECHTLCPHQFFPFCRNACFFNWYLKIYTYVHKQSCEWLWTFITQRALWWVCSMPAVWHCCDLEFDKWSAERGGVADGWETQHTTHSWSWPGGRRDWCCVWTNIKDHNQGWQDDNVQACIWCAATHFVEGCKISRVQERELLVAACCCVDVAE